MKRRHNRYHYPLMAISALTVLLAVGCQKDPVEQPAAPQSEAAPPATQPTAPSAVDQAGSNLSQGAENMGDAAADAAITAKVKTALIGTEDLKSLQINVDTVNGVVTLTGNVDTPQNIDRAAQVAQTVEGVKSVSNQLSVKAQG